MNIGTLRHRVILKHRALSDADTVGHTAAAYVPYATVWARVETISGREIEYARQIHAEASVKVTVRYNADIVETDRIEYMDRDNEVVHINDIQNRHAVMVLTCTEVKGDE